MDKSYSKFEENEIPFQTLEQFGLTQEMIEDLPMKVLEGIMSGRNTPLLPIQVTDEEGNTIRCKARLRVYRQENGKVDALFIPQLQHCNLEQYTPDEQERLLAGKAIVSNSPDDGRTKCFVQIDAVTNQVMYVPTPVIGRNLRSVMENFQLAPAEIQLVQTGESLTIVDGNEPLTLGVDLNEETGIHMVIGDAVAWNETRKHTLDRYNFGIFGCWMVDNDGNLEYVHEEDYSEELLAEQKKVIAANSGMKL